MKKLILKIKKEKCKDTCPIPVNLIPTVEKGIKKISYDKKTEIAEILYDEKLLSEKQVISKIKKIGYKVKYGKQNRML